MKDYQIVIDDLDQAYVIEALGTSPASILDFAKKLNKLLEPLIRTKLELSVEKESFKYFRNHLEEYFEGEEYMDSIALLRLNFAQLNQLHISAGYPYQFYWWNGIETKYANKAIAYLANTKESRPDCDCKLLVPAEDNPYSLESVVSVVAERIDLPPSPAIVINIGHLKSALASEAWARTFYPLRYNFSAKHGDEKTKGQSKNKDYDVEQFRSNENRANALFADSVWDFRDGMRWYNFDPDHQMLIVFHFEGNIPQNQFHCYHFSLDDVKSQRRIMPNHLLRELKERLGF